MTRKHWLAASAVIVLIAVALAALFWKIGDSNVSESLDGMTAQEGALTPEMQTPVYVPPTETLDETEDAEADAAATQTAVLLPSKYQFQSAEDALNYYAKMVGDEAERMKNDPSFTPPEPGRKENGEMIYDDKHVSWEDSWYGGVATSLVQKKIFDDDEYPGLKEALLPFINDWEPHDWSPPHLMVRAGKWPSATLRNDVKLPNGQIIDLNTMLDKRVVVKYRMQTGRSEMERQKIVENLMRDDSEIFSEILSNFRSEVLSGGELESSKVELLRSLMIHDVMQEPEYTDYERVYNDSYAEDGPELEEVVFDLGVIDEDLSAK